MKIQLFEYKSLTNTFIPVFLETEEVLDVYSVLNESYKNINIEMTRIKLKDKEIVVRGPIQEIKQKLSKTLLKG